MVVFATPAVDAMQAGELLEAAGRTHGFVVFVGGAGAPLLADLASDQALVGQTLCFEDAELRDARARIRQAGVYGRVSACLFAGDQLPYTDNLVNTLVVWRGDIGGPEIERVLAPRGVALVRGNVPPGVTDQAVWQPVEWSSGRWFRYVKPVPKDIDDWTHYLHGPDNNAVARDTTVGPPRSMQWRAEPMWGRDHHSEKGTYPTVRTVLSAAGRLICMIDQTRTSDMRRPSKWRLVARDAFSGVKLWEYPVPTTHPLPRRLAEVWRRLIAGADEVYGFLGEGKPLGALSAATGKFIRSYAGTEDFREVIRDGDALFVLTRAGEVVAFPRQSSQPRWRWRPEAGESVVPITLAADAGKVFLKTTNAAVCLAGDTGKVVWRHPLAGPEKRTKLRFPYEKLLVGAGVVLVSYGGRDPRSLMRDAPEFLGSHPRVREYAGRMAALSVENGRLLWECPYYPNLESAPGEIYIIDGKVWSGPDFSSPRDVRTGKILATRDIISQLWTDGHHYRCFPGKATSRFILTAKRGIEFIDLQGNNHSRNNWVRGTCRVGVTPCNGMVYAPPHSCGCYMEAKLVGFWALAPRRSVAPVPVEERLVRGAAYGKVEDGPAGAEDWPTYRGNTARSGACPFPIGARLKSAWTVPLGGRLTAPTVAGETVFVAQVDQHTLHALSTKDGSQRWQFTAGGRIDSPPTIYRGMVLFGSHDGWVYCLRGTDGALVWRFLAAPAARSAVAFDQPESLWPVHGSVLVKDGKAYFSAGRSSYLDGGISVYALAPTTGKVLHQVRLKSTHPGLNARPENAARYARKLAQNWMDYKTFTAPDRSDSFSMRGLVSDILVADEQSVFLRQGRFTADLKANPEKRQHLFSTSTLLDDYEHNRSYWVLGTGDFSRTPVAFPWIVRKSLAVPYGVMMAFDDRQVWVVRRGGRGQTAHALVGVSRPAPNAKTSRLPDFAARSGLRKSPSLLGKTAVDFHPRAILLAGRTLVVGGESTEKGLLALYSVPALERQTTFDASAPPVWDGLAAAGGALYASLADGRIACWAAGR